MTENMDKWAFRNRKIEKSGYRVAAKMIPFPRRWHGGMISANPEAIWAMSDQVTFRKKIYETIEQLQIDLDQWIDYYNNECTHQGKVCEGRTPMQTLIDGKAIWKEKFVG